jgi:hypothetical protein
VRSISIASRAALGAALCVAPGGLSAQHCLGGASFADRFARVDAEASFATGSRSMVGGLSLGSRAGPFASVKGGLAYDDAAADHATLFSGSAGMAFRPLSPARLEACPFASASAINDAKVPSGQQVSGFYTTEIASRAFGLGASVGRVIAMPPGVELIPFAGAAFFTQTTTIYDAPNGTAAVTDQGHVFMLGAGLVFGQVVAVRPYTTITEIAGETTTSSGVQLSIGFGRRPSGTHTVQGEGSSTTVWVNPRDGMYYCPGSKSYASSESGSFMTERDAVKAGWQPAIGKRC